MVIYRMAMILAGVSISLVYGEQHAPCPSDTVPVNLTSGDDVQNLTDAMNCAGAGVYNVILHGCLQVDTVIEISAQKQVTFTGYLDYDDRYRDDLAVIDAGGTTGIFRVSNGSTLSIKDLHLRGGYSEDGGAVAVTSSSTFNASGCVFTNNGASTAGGAIFADRSSVYILDGVDFLNNTAKIGGAIFARHSEIYNDDYHYNNYKYGAQFWGNSADVGDINNGAEDLVDQRPPAIIEQTNSRGSLTTNDPKGALYANGSVLVFNRGTYFSNNLASTSGGGAIYAAAGSVSFAGSCSFFQENYAEGDGGAVSIIEPNDVNIYNARFALNTADKHGGAIYMASAKTISAVVCRKCKFYDNHATYGGGIYIFAEEGTPAVLDSDFKNNSASSSGGAIFCAGALQVVSSQFRENMAGQDGMAIGGNIRGFSSVQLEHVYFGYNGKHCPAGQYQPFQNVVIPAGFLATCNGCAAGVNMVPNGVMNDSMLLVPVCEDPPTGTSAPSKGTTTRSLALDTGYYRLSSSDEKIHKCNIPEACRGGNNPYNYCATGYENPYCYTCSNHFVTAFDGSCRLCPEIKMGTYIGVVSAVSIALLLAAILFARHLGREVDGDLTEGSAEPQGFFERTIKYFRDAMIKPLSLPAIKIVVVVWQIVFQFSAIAEDVYPEEYKIFLSYLRFVNFDISAILSYSCLIPGNMYTRFYDRLLLSTITPLFVLMLLAFRYFIALRRYRISLQHILVVRRRCLSAALFVAFFVYSSVSSTIFQTFSCVDILKISYLRADYGTRCDDDLYQRFKLYAGMMVVVYPIGIPAVVFTWLIRNREYLTIPDREENTHLQPFIGVWDTYIPSRYYFEVVEYCRRLTLAMSSALLVPDSVDHIAVTLSIVVAFLFVSESLSPFKRSEDSGLYRWGNGVVSASMYVALLMKAKGSHYDFKVVSVLGWVLITANVVMIVAVIVEAVFLGRKFENIVRRVEPIFPPVRRPPSVNVRSVTTIAPTMSVEDGSDGTIDVVSPTRGDILLPAA